MLRFIAPTAAILLFHATSSMADEEKDVSTRSLAEDATYLAKHSGNNGWRSSEIIVKQNGEASTGQLVLVFYADEGKSEGVLNFGVKSDATEIRGILLDTFELVEKDGKRFIANYRITGVTGVREKEPWVTLAYTIKHGGLIVKSTSKVSVDGWVGFEANLEEATTFKPRK